MGTRGDRVRHEIQYQGASVAFVLPSKDDHISKTLITTGSFYELPMLEAASSVLQPGDLVVDAGANIGNHTLYFSRILKCRVEAFEAIPETASLLRENVELNGVTDLVQVHQVALGEKKAKARIASFDAANIGGATLAVDRRGGIQVRSLDDFLGQAQVRLLKVDVEGMDLAVLKGARGILSNSRPWVFCEAGNSQAFDAIREFMAGVGYKPTAVYNATDTYLFLPSLEEPERESLIDRAFAQIMDLQREERALAARLAQAGRYSERMKKEAIAEMGQQLQAWGASQANLERELQPSRVDLEAGKREIARLEHELQSSRAESEALPALRQELSNALDRCSQLEFEKASIQRELASLDRRRLALETELEEARSSFAAERTSAAQHVKDLDARNSENGREIASLIDRLAGVRAAFEQQKSTALQLEEMRAAKSAADDATRAQRVECEKQRGMVARQEKEIADKQRRLAAAHRALQQAEDQLTKSKGLAGRQEKEVADKQRRLIDAHRVLRETSNHLAKSKGLAARQERELSDKQRRLANAHRVLASRQEELDAIRKSLSFRLGRMIVGSMRSPTRALSLTWTVPRLLWNEWRKDRVTLQHSGPEM